MIAFGGTVRADEAIFIVAGAITMLLNVAAYDDARADLRVLLTSGRNGLMRMAAYGGVARELRRAALQAILLGAGLLAATAPTDGPITWRGYIIRSLLIAFQIGIAEGAWADRRVRRRMMSYDDARHALERSRGAGDDRDAA